MIEPELLLQGYRLGVFPMAMEDGEIEWFSPDPRAILPLRKFHVPHALQRERREKRFSKFESTPVSPMSCGRARSAPTPGSTTRSSRVTRACMSWVTRIRSKPGSDGKLAGGLYGVAIGGAFFGESMFHRVTDASKIALCGLVEHLRERKFILLDTQWLTPHLCNSAASKFREINICICSAAPCNYRALSDGSRISVPIVAVRRCRIASTFGSRSA